MRDAGTLRQPCAGERIRQQDRELRLELTQLRSIAIEESSLPPTSGPAERNERVHRRREPEHLDDAAPRRHGQASRRKSSFDVGDCWQRHDRIAQPLRNLWNPATKTGEVVDFFVACPWCFGTWLSVAGAVAWGLTHQLGVWDVVGVAAVASVAVGIVGDRA